MGADSFQVFFRFLSNRIVIDLNRSLCIHTVCVPRDPFVSICTEHFPGRDFFLTLFATYLVLLYPVPGACSRFLNSFQTFPTKRHNNFHCSQKSIMRKKICAGKQIYLIELENLPNRPNFKRTIIYKLISFANRHGNET